MNRRPLSDLFRRFFSNSSNNKLSFGFSGAGFLGCYHVGVAACLYRQGLLPNPNDSSTMSPPLVTGVSAGSMIATAVLAGVNPDPDGMEVVLEAARKTRALAKANDFNVSLDVLTPGFSLIDQVEEPFRVAIVKALGGKVPDSTNNSDEEVANNYDIDPDLFTRRFPNGSLRLGLTDRRVLGIGQGKLLESYRYVDSFRDVDDIIATCMLSSYIPAGTGPLHLHDKLPGFFNGLFNKQTNTSTDKPNDDTIINDTVHRSGIRLRLLESAGLVKHGKTGLPTITTESTCNSELDHKSVRTSSTDFWDGGIADVFPIFDDKTIIIAPVNGVFSNPAICPIHPADDQSHDINVGDNGTSMQKQNNKPFPLQLQLLIRSYIPSTFRHCSKAQLGLNRKNARAVLKMTFSSEDEELYAIFREGYDDARRFLNETGQLRVFSG